MLSVIVDQSRPNEDFDNTWQFNVELIVIVLLFVEFKIEEARFVVLLLLFMIQLELLLIELVLLFLLLFLFKLPKFCDVVLLRVGLVFDKFARQLA